MPRLFGLISSVFGKKKVESNEVIVTLTRSFLDIDVTMGMLQISGIDHDPIYTLENPWLDNQKNVSCIPTGAYVCSRHVSPSKGRCLKIHGVEGRTHILIHVGNTEADTQGCILIGRSAGYLHGFPAVLESKRAMEYLLSLVPKKKFILLVK